MVTRSPAAALETGPENCSCEFYKRTRQRQPKLYHLFVICRPQQGDIPPVFASVYAKIPQPREASAFASWSAMDWIKSPVEVPMPTQRERIPFELMGNPGKTSVEVASRIKVPLPTGPVLSAGPMAACAWVKAHVARRSDDLEKGMIPRGFEVRS